MSSVLAFIPARAGSKGIPDKNIRLMNGKPMVYYTLLAALESSCDVVVLSSDSERVHQSARDSFAENSEYQKRLTHHQRPEEIAGDNSPIKDSIIHYLQTSRESFDYVALLQPTSPIRGKGHVDDALKMIRGSQKNTLCAVAEPMQHPADMIYSTPEGFDFLLKRESEAQRQSYQKLYFIIGSLYVARMDYFLKAESFFDPMSADLFVTNGAYSMDVDTMDQFEIAEAVQRNLKMAQDG